MIIRQGHAVRAIIPSPSYCDNALGPSGVVSLGFSRRINGYYALKWPSEKRQRAVGCLKTQRSTSGSTPIHPVLVDLVVIEGPSAASTGSSRPRKAIPTVKPSILPQLLYTPFLSFLLCPLRPAFRTLLRDGERPN